MKLRTQQLMIIIIAHYIFHPFYIGGISIPVQQIIIFGSLGLYAFLHFNVVVEFLRSFVNHKYTLILTLISLFMILISSILIPIIYQTNDFSYFSRILRVILYTFTYIMLVIFIRQNFKDKTPKTSVLETYILVQRNYVLTTLVFLISPILKMNWINFINETPHRIELIQKTGYTSRVSWDGYAGFSSTVAMTIAVIISIYLIVEYYEKYKVLNKKHLVSLVICLVGNSFYGRSGLLISLLMIGIGIIYLVIEYKLYYIVPSLIGMLVFLFITITVLSNYNQTISTWYNWAMEPILSLLETGTIQTSSTDTLWDMWFMPDLRTFLIGDGYYTNPLSTGYYMKTDVGYLRPILFYGIFYTLISLFLPVILGLDIAKGNRANKLLSFMFLTSLFLFEIKGEVALTFSSILIMIFVASYIKKPDINSKKEEYTLLYEQEYQLND